MKHLPRHQLSLVLMIGSLLLLLGFLGIWLQKEYEGEKNRLVEAGNHLFFEAIRDLRDSLFSEIFEAPLVLKLEGLNGHADSSQVSMFGKDAVTQKDLNVQIARMKKLRYDEMTDIDSTTKITIYNRFRTTFKRKGRPGSLSIYLAMAADSGFQAQHYLSDSLALAAYSEQARPLIQAAVARAMEARELPLPFFIAEQTEEAEPLHGQLATRRYVDIPTGKAYSMVFPVYREHVLGNILPQILFSLLLFSGIGLAFVLIYQSLLRQRKLSQLKNEFISNVTHELKTPITTVGVAIEAMSNFQALDDPARTREYLDISRQELNRLSILVDRVLRMAQFEQGEPELTLEPLDMKELLQGILASMRLQFDRLAARVEVQFSGAAFAMKGDRVHLTSVIYNLIDNALKYSQQPEIRIGLSAAPGGLQLRVADNGVGIAREYQEKVFEKFFRVPSGDLHNVKGHGLGLSYVASVVSKHSGSIELESEPGQGTAFTLFFPQDHP